MYLIGDKGKIRNCKVKFDLLLYFYYFIVEGVSFLCFYLRYITVIRVFEFIIENQLVFLILGQFLEIVEKFVFFRIFYFYYFVIILCWIFQVGREYKCGKYYFLDYSRLLVFVIAFLFFSFQVKRYYQFLFFYFMCEIYIFF